LVKKNIMLQGRKKDFLMKIPKDQHPIPQYAHIGNKPSKLNNKIKDVYKNLFSGKPRNTTFKFSHHQVTMGPVSQQKKKRA
jgi:hypothetical protein